MNRRLLIQVTAPAVVIGLLLLGACLASAWYINRLQTNLAKILSQNVTSLQAAQELEIRVRQLRYHTFLYVIDHNPERLGRIEEDHEHFEHELQLAKQSVHTPEERACLQRIEDGYQQYRKELAGLVNAPEAEGGMDFRELADAHPIQRVVEPCQDLLSLNREMMSRTARDSERLGRQAPPAMLLLGLAGPVSGLIIGYGIARGLSRFIYQLSVRLQGMAQCLDQDVASLSVAADGDIRNLDMQLQHVVRRVEDVAQRLQQHQREMLRAEQLSAVGQLAASVAHEVRNPLTAVKMLVEAAWRSDNRKPLTTDDLEVIHGEVARLEKTVQDFLDFARLPTPRRSACNLNEIVAQAVELVRVRAAQQGVETTVHARDEVVPVSVDRSQMRTVLVNLFLNALDAMPRGGRLDVDLQTLADAGARLVVADTGSGIAEEILDRLFTPFASGKPTGTGLGLSISQRIIEEHGGRITGGNRPEGGACFTITLPASRGAEAAAHGQDGQPTKREVS